MDNVDMRKFVTFTEAHRDEINRYWQDMDAVKFTLLMVSNADESGTIGVVWPTVVTRIGLKKQLGVTEDREHGVPSLVVWAMRKTGPGTSYASINRTELTIWILEHKNNIISYLDAGDVDGLVSYLVATANETKTTEVDWKTVINSLKNDRALFKYPCGFLNLQLCDSTEK